MAELEIGTNLLVVISLIINAVLVPLVLHNHATCKKMKEDIKEL